MSVDGFDAVEASGEAVRVVCGPELLDGLMLVVALAFGSRDAFFPHATVARAVTTTIHAIHRMRRARAKFNEINGAAGSAAFIPIPREGRSSSEAARRYGRTT